MPAGCGLKSRELDGGPESGRKYTVYTKVYGVLYNK